MWKQMITQHEFEGLSQEQMVEFAIFCAEDVLHLNNDRTLEPAKNCIKITKKWLCNHDCVTTEELKNSTVLARWAACDSANLSRMNNNSPIDAAAAYAAWSAATAAASACQSDAVYYASINASQANYWSAKHSCFIFKFFNFSAKKMERSSLSKYKFFLDQIRSVPYKYVTTK
jgi:hypothetical protein